MGSEKEKVLNLRRSHEKDKKALIASQNENLILKKKNFKFIPLPQQAPLTTLNNAAPKVHIVGMEERMKSNEAVSKAFALNAVTYVFDLLYCAIERSSSVTVTDGHYTAKYLAKLTSAI